MRKPEYTRALTDDTMLAVLQGNQQIAYPIRFGSLKEQIVSGAQKVGDIVFESNAFTVTFSSPLSTSDYIVAYVSLPDNVNPDSITRTVNGFSGTYIGEGSGTGSFIAAVKNNS